MTNLETLRRLLAAARDRRDSQPPSSPDWDAATEAVEELTRRIAQIERPDRRWLARDDAHRSPR